MTGRRLKFYGLILYYLIIVLSKSCKRLRHQQCTFRKKKIKSKQKKTFYKILTETIYNKAKRHRGQHCKKKKIVINIAEYIFTELNECLMWTILLYKKCNFTVFYTEINKKHYLRHIPKKYFNWDSSRTNLKNKTRH